jgi:hypothetical protein
MPLDVAVSPKNLTATLHYPVRGAEKPVHYVDVPPPGAAPCNGIDDAHEVRIEDGRAREAGFTLDRNGFALVRAPTQVHDYSPGEVNSTYYSEIERLLSIRAQPA